MFNGIWLVALEPLEILGREVQPGERFEISRTQSGPFLVMGRARIAASQTPPPKEPAPAPRRRGRPRKTETTEITQTVEETAATEPPAEATEPTRRYRRRDLEAEP